ncbi:MAG: hypothetical protein IIV99_01740 [Oscillospiraceae bacterium]|nr:hypothetical protein [Oscillospiraceae bacterium]
MRYFKYTDADKTYNNALKEQYKSLTKDEKATVRKEKMWTKISIVVYFVLFAIFLLMTYCLLKYTPPQEKWGWDFALGAAKVLIGLGLFVLSGVLAAVLVTPFWEKAESYNIPKMKKEFSSKACEHLRSYYGLQQPYIVTKCFDATDKKFCNKDVCVFVVGEELRITTDIVKGFIHGERDLGCYAFEKQEVVLTKKHRDNQLVVQLEADGTMFLLHYRAKSFIEKNFICAETK